MPPAAVPFAACAEMTTFVPVLGVVVTPARPTPRPWLAAACTTNRALWPAVSSDDATAAPSIATMGSGATRTLLLNVAVPGLTTTLYVPSVGNWGRWIVGRK